MTFPETDTPLHTDVSFDEMLDDVHYIGPNPLRRLSVDMVAQFPLDYIHLVCLGVMKRLIKLWMKGPTAVQIGCRAVSAVSEVLVSFHKFIPKEFAQKPRGLNEVS